MSETPKLPKRYAALYHRLRRGQWRETELRWLLAHDPQLPPLVRWVIEQQLNAQHVQHHLNIPERRRSHD